MRFLREPSGFSCEVFYGYAVTNVLSQRFCTWSSCDQIASNDPVVIYLCINAGIVDVICIRFLLQFHKKQRFGGCEDSANQNGASPHTGHSALCGLKLLHGAMLLFSSARLLQLVTVRKFEHVLWFFSPHSVVIAGRSIEQWSSRLLHNRSAMQFLSPIERAYVSLSKGIYIIAVTCALKIAATGLRMKSLVRLSTSTHLLQHSSILLGRLPDFDIADIATPRRLYCNSHVRYLLVLNMLVATFHFVYVCSCVQRVEFYPKAESSLLCSTASDSGAFCLESSWPC